MFGFPVEPNADMRNAASGIYESYVALTQAGFTEQQALHLTTEMLRATIQKGSGNADG